MHQTRVEPPQLCRFPKHHVDGPFALVGGPVVREGVLREDLPMNRVQLSGNRLQLLWAIGSQLLVHQPLPLGPVFDPWKAVACGRVLDPFSVHLPPQPLPPVHADLNGKREPCLNPRIHEAELRMDPVLIEEQALPLSATPTRASSSPDSDESQNSSTAPRTSARTPAPRRHRRGPAISRAISSLLTWLEFRYLTGRPSSFASLSDASFNCRLTPLHMGTEVLQQNVVRVKVVPHPINEADGSQRPSEHQPIETRQRASDLVSMLRDKLVHGASALRMLCFVS